jgi:hypothetical protein
MSVSTAISGISFLHWRWSWRMQFLSSKLISFIPLLRGKRQSYPCNRPWRPIGMWEVEAPTFFRESVHRWRRGCQPYTSAALYPSGRFLVLISRLSRPQGHSAAGRIRSIEKPNDLIGNWTRDLPACNIVPQPTTLPRAALLRGISSLFHDVVTQTVNNECKGMWKDAIWSHVK